MGLTIYYTLDLSGDQPESRALEWVQTLREAAVTLGAKPVTSVLRVVRSDCERLDSEKLDLEWLVRCFAIRGVEDPRDPQRFLNVLPDLAFGFGAMIGRCEPVVLGLGRHPATVTDSGIEVTTGLTNWELERLHQDAVRQRGKSCSLRGIAPKGHRGAGCCPGLGYQGRCAR